MFTAARVFRFSDGWSGGFISLRVMMGQSALDFAAPPIVTLGAALLSAFLLYLLCGAVSVLTAVVTGREEAALLVSLMFGIAAGLLNMNVTSYDAKTNALRCAVIAAAIIAVFALCLISVKRRDFS
jgi:hypothetical protein